MELNGVQMEERYAVIATGIVTPGADIVVLKSSTEERCPIIVGIYPSKEKAARMARRMASKVTRVEAFVDKSLVRGTPIYGVQPVLVPFRQPREAKPAEPTPHERAAAVLGEGKPPRQRRR